MLIFVLKFKYLEKVRVPRQHIIKQRHYFATESPSSQGCGFSSSHVRMWELDYKESWPPKNWCFWTVVLERTLECPVFPTPLIEEVVFSPLNSLPALLQIKCPLSVWVHLWTFFLVSLVYISVFVLVPHCLDVYSLVVYSEVRKNYFAVLFFFLKIALAIWGLLYKL